MFREQHSLHPALRAAFIGRDWAWSALSAAESPYNNNGDLKTDNWELSKLFKVQVCEVSE